VKRCTGKERIGMKSNVRKIFSRKSSMMESRRYTNSAVHYKDEFVKYLDQPDTALAGQ
jgi:hypothetical protein